MEPLDNLSDVGNREKFAVLWDKPPGSQRKVKFLILYTFGVSRLILAW